MYTDYWHLTSKPFESGSDSDFYYPSEAHQAALLKLRYAVENRRGGALLAGGSGLGKTLLIQSLRRLAPENIGPFVHVVFPKMAPHELLAYIAGQLSQADIDLTGHRVDDSIRLIERSLRDNSEKGRHAVLALDEAHLLADDGSLEMVRLLFNFEFHNQPGMTILLAGQPGMLPVLDRHPALDERLAVKCLLRPLNLEETVSYVNHRLNAAGAKRAIFENDALQRLYSLTHGAPRQINRLCDLALLIGFADQVPSISADQLDGVCQELVAVAPE